MGLEVVVVHRQFEAVAGHAGDSEQEFFVDVDVFEDLQHDPVRVERNRWHVDEEWPRQVDERFVRPGDPVEPDLHEGVEHGK